MLIVCIAFAVCSVKLRLYSCKKNILVFCKCNEYIYIFYIFTCTLRAYFVHLSKLPVFYVQVQAPDSDHLFIFKHVYFLYI